MSEHDKFCDSRTHEAWCDCRKIEVIRADEAQRIALKWQTGGWSILVKPFRTGNAIGLGQLVTDWLRAEANR